MAFYYSGHHSDGNVVCGFSQVPKRDFLIYAKGYYWAASTLSDSLLSKAGYADYQGYPIIYLYRQSLELALKGIIYNAVPIADLLQNPSQAQQLQKHHRLVDLFGLVERVLDCAELFVDDPSFLDFMEHLGTIVKEFDRIDPGSYSFRYPINSLGKKSTGEHLLLNIVDIAKTFSSIFPKLEALDMGIQVKRERLLEITAYLQEFFDRIVT
jgi:hypothetical protein